MTLHLILNAKGRCRKEFLSTAFAITWILLVTLPGVALVRATLSDQHARLLPSQVPATFSSPSPLPPPFQSESRLSTGKFLVASRRLSDPNFSETVVLLIDYTWNGAIGLIINRPTDVKLSMVLPDIQGLQQRTDTVYIGGPVERNRLWLLIRSGSPPEESRHVFADIFVSSSRMELKRMIDEAETGGRFRVYAGYAGWAPGQLDREVSRGDWYVVQADAETVFEKAPSEIWPEFIHRMSAPWVRAQEADRQKEAKAASTSGRRGR